SGAIPPSLGIATGNTLEALCCAWLVERFAKGLDFLSLPRTVLIFSGAAALSCALAASLGLLSLLLAGMAGPVPHMAWLTWWLGDFAGQLLVLPLVLLWGRQAWRNWSRNEGLEFAA